MGKKNRGKDYRLRLAAAVLLVIMVMSLGIFTSYHEERVARETEMAFAPQVGEPTYDDIYLLSRMVAAEAKGEPFEGQVAVAAVMVNRVRSPRFPGTVSGVLFEPWAFEPVMNGHFWNVNVTDDHIRATQMALNGYDPTYGSLFFWNPATATSPWIWTRRIVVSIGKHVFGN